MGEENTWEGSHLSSYFRAVDEHAGPERVFSVRLAGTNLPEEWRIEDFEKGFLSNIVSRKVAEDTGLHIPPGIDMEVHPAPCHAAIGQPPIVPEINEEN